MKKRKPEKKPVPKATEIADATLTRAHALNVELLSIWATLSPSKAKAADIEEQGDGHVATLLSVAAQVDEAKRLAGKIKGELGSLKVENVTE